MSPTEHYFENLLTMGSDIKGEPNKNALSKEVQEAVETCASYIKFDASISGNIEDIIDDTVTNEHIEQLKKLKSFHNGSYGADINFAIDSMIKLQKIRQIFKDIEECPLVEDNALDEIKEIIKDGNRNSDCTQTLS